MKLILATMMVVLAGSVLAEEVRKPIFTGQVGSAPVQVMYEYLQNRISNELGIGEYQQLVIKQTAAGPENFKQVQIETQLQGLLDDSVRTQRFQLSMSFNDATSVWLIDSVKQDWQCRRGNSRAWTQKPCK
ncbi:MULTISPECIES: hypothetical protein [Deefgea]|uniref:Uncharacterized protein n=1 Tax=Deefgea chitinilytica TaxID=570276 RepID=A0ABS2C9N3_9NEIS|nr:MULTISPECIES: hypothetical protein [Deefgea]MBM5570203.1 hypothetical protein [Deefgea chitinilytica]MBM9887432.1 hypothetical protein [Deefgea sp. CFH1-16]